MKKHALSLIIAISLISFVFPYSGYAQSTTEKPAPSAQDTNSERNSS